MAMKKAILLLFLVLTGVAVQAQCARCKHPKVYIEKRSNISYPCVHWYRATKRAVRMHTKSHRRRLFIHI